MLAVKLASAWFADGNSREMGRERAGLDHADLLNEIAMATSVEVETQLRLGGRFVDLEIKFLGGAVQRGKADPLIRVEVKHGIKPHGGQVMAYEQRDRFDSPTVPVVILAPAADLPFDDAAEAPPTVPQRSWQALGRMVKQFAAERPRTSKEIWLVEQFLEFLKEEGLMPIERITDEEMQALALAKRAEAALNELMEGTQAWIEQHWTKSNGSGGKGLGAYLLFPTLKTDQSGVFTGDPWFELKATDADAVDLPATDNDGLHFIAGLSVAKKDFPLVSREQSELLCEADFHVFREGSNERVMRIARPADLLADLLTLDDQIEALGKWAVDAFEAYSAQIA